MQEILLDHDNMFLYLEKEVSNIVLKTQGKKQIISGQNQIKATQIAE